MSSQFSSGEILSIIAAWIVLSVAITYRNLVGFLPLWLLVPAGFLSTVAAYGLLLNVGLGSFNMLPVSLLDGAKIFRKSIPIGLGIALPLWTMFPVFNFLR